MPFLESNTQMKKDKISYYSNSGFKAPQEYFEGLENELLNKIHFNEGLRDIKHAGFTVPKGYFDEMEDELLKKATPNKPKVRSLITKEAFLYAASIAAIIIAFASTFYINPENQTSWENVELGCKNHQIRSSGASFSARSEGCPAAFRQGLKTKGNHQTICRFSLKL